MPDPSPTPQPPRPLYRMPAEWEPHAGIWMSWPHREESWPGRFEPVPEAYGRLVAAIARFETVSINTGDGEDGLDLSREAGRILDALGVPPARTVFIPVSTDDAWCRDHGPVFVEAQVAGSRRKSQAVLDWEFNAWGGKYEPYGRDNAVPSEVGSLLGLDVVRPGCVLEGGSVDVNGAGTLLTTESCLLNPNRNPSLSREEIEEKLALYLGATNVLWLARGIEGDDTDGHIDDLARFVDRNTVVAAAELDPGEPDHAVLSDNLARLRSMADQDGRPLDVVELPMPTGVTVGGEPVPASYANFLIVNGGVIVPTYGHVNDDAALRILARCFPGREVVPVDCIDLIWGLGAVHCLTQQWPVAP